MRHNVLSTVLLLLSSLALTTTANTFSPFLSALELQDPLDSIAPNTTIPESSATPIELAKRQTTTLSSGCPTGYGSCYGLGAPGLCCANSAICSADYAGHVACCPRGAACTGSISSVITGGTIAGAGGVVATSTTGLQGATTTTTTAGGFVQSTAATTNNGGLVVASQATTAVQSTTNGFIIASGTTVANPNAGMRTADVPLTMQLVLGVLGILRWI